MDVDEFVYNPSQDYVEETNIFRFASKNGFGNLKELYIRADNDPEWFWPRVIEDCGIQFTRPYDAVFDQSGGKPWTRWFINGKLNIAYNCVQRHSMDSRTAIVFENEQGISVRVTFSEMDLTSGKLAGALQSMGVQKGDRVGIFMPISPEAIFVMYAAMRIGAIAVPIFSGYGEEALRTRVEDAGVKVLFVTNSFQRRGKEVNLAEIARRVRGPVRVIHGVRDKMPEEYDYYDLVDSGTYVACMETDAEDPALILYTSGTTGKPKGTVHVHAALANIVKEVKYYVDVRRDDTLFWITDLGWMMGPWAVIGAHALGASVMVYDGAMDYPAPDRLWSLVEGNGVSILGLSPTVARSLMASGQGRRFSGVRVFGSTGEPWDTRSWMYLFRNLGGSEVPICNISGGTDIIGCFLASTPAIPMKPRSLYMGLGMGASVYDEDGNQVYGRIGYLVAKNHTPSMTRGLWNNTQKYLETYWSRFSDVWFHGDWAIMDIDGYFFLFGRADDVIKVAGKRVGPSEVEDIVMSVPGVRECAAVGYPHQLKGEVLAVVYTGEEGVDKAIREAVRERLGKPFEPYLVIRATSLPKTRNGKIVRRAIRQALAGGEQGDMSGVENPEAVEEIVRAMGGAR
ncbi:AMP-dependent synthetase [Thermogymnomonas acidicola]|uniref:acetate--CoA ligase n=1 Tax=Thermogymnomonas acidicola TaxID=399579 RepID=A0AA37BQ42_9ARCH|nr:AMP-binding protein [Thermogymnomonas acidicola]GGM68870.1 AMP-dependent synthetase [Thermogymnomonas acidicola]